MADKIPDIVVARLPIYLRSLRHMNAEGLAITSSSELANILGASAAQIRKDLSHFGEFGKQGTGYHVPYLINQLEKILKADRVWDVALVGVGDLGHALLNNRGMERRGFRIVVAFDSDMEKIGTRVGNVIIQNTSRLIEEISMAKIKLAIVAVSVPSAQMAADSLVEAGVRCILNYSPIALAVPDNIRVQYIDPVTHLQHMSYYL